MPQFYVPRKNIRGTFFFFDESESRHLAKVLRKKSGDIVEIFDGKGTVLSAKIIDVSNPNQVKGEILESADPVSPAKKLKSLKVYPALIKGERFEWMLEKLTELGVDLIQPAVTERTIVHIRPEQSDSKLDRWKKVVLSAAKQCGRQNLPEIFSPLKFEEGLKQIDKNEMNLLLWEGEPEQSLLSIAARAKGPLSLFVGPEGGFTIDEANRALSAGLISVRLGDNILRAETAAIAAASLILFS